MKFNYQNFLATIIFAFFYCSTASMHGEKLHTYILEASLLDDKKMVTFFNYHVWPNRYAIEAEIQKTNPKFTIPKNAYGQELKCRMFYSFQVKTDNKRKDFAKKILESARLKQPSTKRVVRYSLCIKSYPMFSKPKSSLGFYNK